MRWHWRANEAFPTQRRLEIIASGSYRAEAVLVPSYYGM
jgi:hypothetical protein